MKKKPVFLILLISMLNFGCVNIKLYRPLNEQKGNIDFKITYLGANEIKVYQNTKSNEIVAFGRERVYKIDYTGKIKDTFLMRTLPDLTDGTDMVYEGNFYTWLEDGDTTPKPFAKIYNQNFNLEKNETEELVRELFAKADKDFREPIRNNEEFQQRVNKERIELIYASFYSFKINNQWIGVFSQYSLHLEGYGKINQPLINLIKGTPITQVHFKKERKVKDPGESWMDIKLSDVFLAPFKSYYYWVGTRFYQVPIGGKLLKFYAKDGSDYIRASRIYKFETELATEMPFVIIEGDNGFYLIKKE